MKAPIFLLGVLSALGAGWAGFPRLVYKTVPQPVNFSHKVHAEKAGSKCEDCHALRPDGTFAGIPALEKCASCHAAPMGTMPAEKAFIDQYVTPGREPQWADYARQPGNVYFSHAAHIRHGQVKCETCHGNVGASDSLPPYSEDRVSGYSRQTMSMDACMGCHQRSRMVDSCLECHK
jgi:menaquinone reductase, multiheme cytochrome c subunit